MPIVPREPPKYEALAEMAKQYPMLEPSAIRGYLALLRVSSELEAAVESQFAHFGLSQGRFTILMLLRRHPEGLSPAVLADLAGVKRPTVTGLLDTLERDQLVARQCHAYDHRVTVVHLTQKATELLEKMLPAHFEKIAALTSGLTLAECEELTRLLLKIQPQIAV